MKTEVIGNATLYHGDCRDILPTLIEDADVVITDPPYDIGAASWAEGWMQPGVGKARLWGERPEWDVAPSPEILASITSVPSIIWGGNYFPGLPISKGWLVWDKCTAMTQAQAELAWSNVAPNARVFHKSPLGVFGNGGANEELKEHPTQKPASLMTWCIELCGENVKRILDPYMGSGSTGVAAVRMARIFVGVEREINYFDIACRRIEDAQRQQRMFA